MKKEMLMAIGAIFLISIPAISGVNAVGGRVKVVTISENSTDITGDAVNEVISLKGVPYQNDDSYLKMIYIEVLASNGKTYKFPLEGGSSGLLELVDLNHDGIKDIFATVQTGGSGGITIHFLYSMKDFIQTHLPVPDPLEAESGFLNGYKATLKIAETGKSYLFDLSDRKKYYQKLGFYHNGKLNEPTELTVNPFSSLKPTYLNEEQMGLTGIQRVTGIANADTIVYIKSSWLYVGDKWKLVNAVVQKEVGNS